MSKMNCWEIRKCGREPGGSNVQNEGVCPAATDASCNGINSGRNGGRICWAVAGTFCGSRIEGLYAHKLVSCMSCEVFLKVKEEEGKNFRLLRYGQAFQSPSR